MNNVGVMNNMNSINNINNINNMNNISNMSNMNNLNNRMNMNNNQNFQPNIYQPISQFSGNNFESGNYMSGVGGTYQNVGMNNPYMMGSGNNTHFNNSPYNMNLLNKGYPQNDFKRISLDKEKQQNFDLNITDINGIFYI